MLSALCEECPRLCLVKESGGRGEPQEERSERMQPGLSSCGQSREDNGSPQECEEPGSAEEHFN